MKDPSHPPPSIYCITLYLTFSASYIGIPSCSFIKKSPHVFHPLVTICFCYQKSMQDAYPKKWLRAPENLRLSVPYVRATILTAIPNGRAEYALQTERGPIRMELPIDQSFQTGNEEDFADMCDMNVLNQPEVLNNILRRYKKDDIFTSIGPTLIVVNPYRTIDRLFSKEIMEAIREKIMTNRLGKDEPHVYLIAGRAYLALKETGVKQAIVISGQSGAGKTQSTKYCMQLLTSLSSRKNNTIESRILACNPVLQAFGNSKTVRNQNSSRFGKYVKIYFNSEYVIKGANIHSYLLEKSRVVSVANKERSFHSFYALLASKKYNMKEASDYELLKQSSCYESTHIDDRKYFEEINTAFVSIGFSEEEIDRIWYLVGCILNLGNIHFDERDHLIDQAKACSVTNGKDIKEIAKMIKIDSTHLQKILLYERKKFLKEYTLSPYNKQHCISNLHTFCKAIYNAIFQFILHKIKLSLAPNKISQSLKEINILDIFGFENFQENSFEQFCINFTNQKLLKLYNTYIFDRQMEILREDGLEKQILGILPPTNNEIISVISGKLSLFSIVNDMTLPQFKDEDIIQGFRKIDHPSLIFDKINRGKFKIIHTQAPVDYNIANFKSKNQDKINQEIMDVVVNLFPECSMKDQAGKTILSKFTKQIDDLMQELNSSSVHFIRCIKPNQSKTPFSPNEKYILTQIRYLGIFQTIMIRKNTFPFRKFYKDFRKQFILMFPNLKKEKDEKKATNMILEELTNNKGSYLMGNERVYISAELENILNLQIYKFLAKRLEKIKILQRGLKKCVQRKTILQNVKIIAQRMRILKSLPCKLENKLKMIGIVEMKRHSDLVKERQDRAREEQLLEKLKEQKRQRQLEEQAIRLKQEQKQNAAREIYRKIQDIIDSNSRNVLDISFSHMKKSQESTPKPFNKPSLSIQQPISNLFQLLNSTDHVGDSAIDNISPYHKPETPSSELIGQNLAFDKSFVESMQTTRTKSSKINSTTLFEGYLQLQPYALYPNPNLPRLKNILSEKYKVQIQGNQEDFFSPPSSHTLFKIEDLSPEAVAEILDFPAEAYFNKILRKRTTFLGSKKTYDEILVCKKSQLNKSMTVMSNQQDQKRSLKIFNTILKIGQLVMIEAVLKYVEIFIEECQSSSIQLKNEIFVQLIRQANSSAQLSAIRNYQAMAVFLHVYNPSEQLLRATLNLYYHKLNKKMGVSQRQYLRYIFSFIMRKIKKKSVIGYLPISYQVMGLMCKRQISIPVYLPTGNSILVKVESYNTFAEIKSRCMAGFGINLLRYCQEYFTFYEVVNFDNEQLDETPIRETNMVWDMMTYWQLTKTKYAESQIKPPNFFLMFKVRYIFQCQIDDEETIELYFSQLYFDFFMGRIMLDQQEIYMLAAIIKVLKYYDKSISEIYMGILPIWFTKGHERQQSIKGIDTYVQQIQQNKISIKEMRYRFAQICQQSELALSTIVPTETDGELLLYFKNKSIILVDSSQKMEVFPLKKMIKWSIDKEYFYFQVAGEQGNRTVKVRTDYASICNEYLKNIPLNKSKALARQKSNFLKK